MAKQSSNSKSGSDDTTQTTGKDDPLSHDVGDDKGTDQPLTHDIGDDKGLDNPLTHDVVDDKGADDPSTRDVVDDHGLHALNLFVNQRTQQLVFSSDSAEVAHWHDDAGKDAIAQSVDVPIASSATLPVWRFHDLKSDVFFWTADPGQKDSLLEHHPELAFDGEAFQAFKDQSSGGHTAIAVVWDRDAAGDYGNFIYAPLDDAVRLAGQSDTDHLDLLGVAFWI
jgi:hypothetical protein